MPVAAEVPIVIVGFGHPEDTVKCLSAIGRQRGCPKFEVFICENGGPAAFDALEKASSEKGGPCEGEVEHIEPASDEFVRAARLRLDGGQTPVTIAQANDNFGFAGGTNAWIRPLLAEPGWTAVWILNPDTWPEPDALAELVDYAKKRGKGMVGSRTHDPWPIRHRLVPGLEMEQAQRQADWRRHLCSGVACSRPRRRRTTDGFPNRAINVCHQRLHRAGRLDGRILFSVLGGSRLGDPRQGGLLRHWLRPQFRGSPHQRQLERRRQRSGQTIVFFGLFEQSKSTSLRTPASSALVSLDPVRSFPQERPVSGGRIDAQFCRRGQRAHRRPARRKGPPEGGPGSRGCLNLDSAGRARRRLCIPRLQVQRRCTAAVNIANAAPR